jgi:carboxyl-terminal processing protease
MQKWFRARRRFSLAMLIVVAASIAAVGFVQLENDYFFKINKSIDLFGRVYKEVTLNYVDQVDPEKFMESGIEGLLSTLDPYTTFYNEKQGDEVELITTGTYGGIGISIGLRDDYVTVISLMEGYSAARQGVLPGDRILEVDGKAMKGAKPDAVRSMTRGEPGTEVHLKIQRESEDKILDFVLVREEIRLKNITYSDFVETGVGYIKLDRFSRGAADELRLAIKELKLKGTLSSLILDLRDNPGGLLEAAVGVVEKFVPKGSTVVSTRGRRPEMEKQYIATEEPILADVPLVVLVNGGSASASEIVAGAIQDLDRGIILGTRTFGKGLVQTVTPLPYNTQLKITTAKYYTPSGRLIQEIDYMHKSGDGVFATVPDSLRKQYKTAAGRTEYERGGITPDSVVTLPDPSAVHSALLRKAMYFRFATRYKSIHPQIPEAFRSNEMLLQEFQQFLAEQKFTFEDDTETKLKELRELSLKAKYGQSVMSDLERLSERIQEEKKLGIERNRQEVLNALRIEIASRYDGEHGRIETSLTTDPQVLAAKGLLTNTREYTRRLTWRDSGK